MSSGWSVGRCQERVMCCFLSWYHSSSSSITIGVVSLMEDM